MMLSDPVIRSCCSVSHPRIVAPIRRLRGLRSVHIAFNVEGRERRVESRTFCMGSRDEHRYPTLSPSRDYPLNPLAYRQSPTIRPWKLVYRIWLQARPLFGCTQSRQRVSRKDAVARGVVLASRARHNGTSKLTASLLLHSCARRSKCVKGIPCRVSGVQLGSSLN